MRLRIRMPRPGEIETHMDEDQSQQSAEDAAGQSEDEVDSDLLELAESRKRGSILRPILFVVVIWFGISIILDWRPELEYFFSSSDPYDVGAVTEFPDKRAENEDWEPQIPHNRYVSIQGIPSRRSRSERHRFFKLIGGDVFVEVETNEESDPYADFTEEDPDPTRADRAYFEGEGRALRLSKVTHRYDGVRKFYLEKYNTRLCGGSKSFRKLAGEIVPECTEGYLIQADRGPKSFWHYLVFASLIGIFVLVNVYWLIRWVRDFVKS